MSEDTRSPMEKEVALFPHHELYLTTRGVRLDVAAMAEVRSLLPSDVSKILGWQRPAGCAGLLVPVCDPNGARRGVRVRLDAPSGGPKFHSPRGSEVLPWIPPLRLLELCGFSRNVLQDVSQPLLVVEDGVKAMALLGVELLAIGLGGASAGGHDKAAKEQKQIIQAHPFLREWVALKGRRLTILFSASVATNPIVADGAALNYLALASAGAQVRFARLPFRADGSDQGPDDLLARCGVQALRDVVDAAVPIAPIERVRALGEGKHESSDLPRDQRQSQVCANLVPLLQDPVFAATLRRSSAAEVEEVALEVQRASGMAKRVVKQAADAFAERLKPRSPNDRDRHRQSVDPRPEIVIVPDDHEVTQAALDALSRSPTLYQRGGDLCEILIEEHVVLGRVQPRRAPIIRRLLPARICEHLTKEAKFILPDDGKHVRPPEYIPRQIEARGQYPGFRRIDRIVDHPVLLADGRILDTNGYDARSATYVHLDEAFPRVASEPLHAEAAACADVLLALVRDFPFVGPADRSAWLAALLTAVARGAFEGSAPLFAVTGNTPGCGKSLLCELIGIIVTGRPIPVMSPATHRAKAGADECVDDQEMQKRLVAHILAGTPLVVIDNARTIGSPALYAALTSHGPSGDRILGASSVVNKGMATMWFATGNNLLLPREMRRRSVRIRLLSKLDDPFKRADLSEPQLPAAAQRRRAELLGAALTILRAYIIASRPDVGLAPLGSFVEWSTLVRNAVVWLGLADPLGTMAGTDEECFDRETATLRSLLAGLEPITRRGMVTSKQILRSLENTYEPNPPLANAVGELVPSRVPTPTQLSHAMEPFRDRVLDGLKLVGKSGNAGWAWSVIRVAPRPKRDESDGSDDQPRSHDR